MKVFEVGATIGLGYLVYKGLMTELAKAPVKEAITVKSEGLLGFKGVTPKELEVAIFGDGIGAGGTLGGVAGTGGFTGLGLTPMPYTPPFSETYDPWSLLYGPLLPEGFELVGPSRTGLTRPKGLD